MLTVDGLCFAYPRGPEVLRDVSFSLRGGTLCGLFGPNGCGKTTLFKCMMRLLPYRRGSIKIGDDELRGIRVRQLARRIGYVPQEHRVTFPFPVRDVVLMGRTPHLRSPFGASDADRRAALQAMRAVGVHDLASTPYNELSGGQRQLVAIARALAQQPRLLLLDEPTSALDFSNQINIWRVLREISAAGATVIACTHDPNHVAWFCDETVVLDEGRVVAAGSVTETMNQTVLGELYGDLCEVTDVGAARLTLPRGLAYGR